MRIAPAGAEEVPPALLGLAMFRPPRAAEVLRGYPGELALAWEGAQVVGVVGYRVEGGRAEILHVAVDPAWQRRGLGRALIEWLARRADALVAETDAGAAGFYRRCGFSVEVAGERRGTMRYLARYRADRSVDEARS